MHRFEARYLYQRCLSETGWHSRLLIVSETTNLKYATRHDRVRKKRRQPTGPARVKPKRPAGATLAGIKREMQEPRLAKSVRDDLRYQGVLAADGAVDG